MGTKFSDGEKVLCYFERRQEIYKAIILQSLYVKDDDVVLYLVHYPGYRKRWDAWVQEPMLLKYSAKILKTMTHKTSSQSGPVEKPVSGSMSYGCGSKESSLKEKGVAIDKIASTQQKGDSPKKSPESLPKADSKVNQSIGSDKAMVTNEKKKKSHTNAGFQSPTIASPAP